MVYLPNMWHDREDSKIACCFEQEIMRKRAIFIKLCYLQMMQPVFYKKKNARNMPNLWNMPNAKIDMPSLQKHAKFVFFGRKYANMATLVVFTNIWEYTFIVT